MIKKIEINNTYIEQIENNFPNFFKMGSIEKSITENPFTKFYVYIENDQVLAFINYDIIYDRAELLYIGVVESYQKNGIATKLLNYMIEDCEKSDVKNITLEVHINNNKAINLYKKFGFKQVALRKNYYQGEDGILMEKEMI